jgi:phosphonate transport system substrate-binding protein
MRTVGARRSITFVPHMHTWGCPGTMKTRQWAAIAAASAMLLVACGNDDAEPDAADDVTDTEETDEEADTDEADADEEEWPESIVLGLVPSQDVDQLVEDADVLAELLSAELGITVDPVVTDNYAAMIVAMQTGQAQVGLLPPVGMAQAADQADANIILQTVRRGTATYHTQWFTNNPDRFCSTDVVEAENPEGNTFTYCNGTDAATEGPVGEDALNQIQVGETISFVDELSASGYFYPATQLQNVVGLDPFTDIDTQFAGNHHASVLAVQRGDAEVGVSFDDARNDVVEEEPEIGQDVVVFAWSDEIPNDGVAVSPDLPQGLQDAIADAMVALIETPEGEQAFFDVYSIEGLVPADLEAVDLARQVAANFGD